MGYEATGCRVQGKCGRFEGDLAQQTGLVWFGEYDLGVELEPIEPDDGLSDVDGHHAAIGGFGWDCPVDWHA